MDAQFGMKFSKWVTFFEVNETLEFLNMIAERAQKQSVT